MFNKNNDTNEIKINTAALLMLVAQADEIIENIPTNNRNENILKALHSQGGNVPVTQ